MGELPSIQQLKDFIIYGKYRNFTAAAEAANITQSAFSAQIKKLEEIVGVQLIARSNRGSHLTKAGEHFFLRVEPLLSELESCLCEMKTFSGEVQPLSIGIMLSLGDVHMNRHLAWFQQHHSGASFRVYNLEARELLQKLKDDELDIISLFLLPGMDVSGYESVCFCHEPIVYYAPNLDVPSSTVSAEFITSHPLAQYSPHYLMNDYLERYLQHHARTAPQTRAWFSTPYAIWRYCQQHHIGALLPQRFLEAMGTAAGMYAIAPAVSLPCYLLYKRSNPNYQAIQVFIQYMKQTYHVTP